MNNGDNHNNCDSDCRDSSSPCTMKLDISRDIPWGKEIVVTCVLWDILQPHFRMKEYVKIDFCTPFSREGFFSPSRYTQPFEDTSVLIVDLDGYSTSETFSVLVFPPKTDIPKKYIEASIRIYQIDVVEILN